MATYPDRPSRMDHYGLFSFERLPFGILYYFFPVWNAAFDRGFPLGGRIGELFDGLELPPSSLLLTDPLIRRRIDVSQGPAFAILAGLACSPALMLTAWYMTFRYRAEFAPFMIAAASLGIAFWVKQLERGGSRQKRIAATLVVRLCGFQVLSTAMSSYSYARAGSGPVSGYRSISLPWTIENWMQKLEHYGGKMKKSCCSCVSTNGRVSGVRLVGSVSNVLFVLQKKSKTGVDGPSLPTLA